MSKKLAELFELPTDEENSLLTPIVEEQRENVAETLSNIEKIENALPQVRGLEASDTEFDNLANLAIESYKNLHELGMQVDSRFSAEIFGVASNMLGHAITAKTAKVNKKLKTIELQLKKAMLDAKLAAKAEEVESTPVGEGKALDRNELLKMLASKS